MAQKVECPYCKGQGKIMVRLSKKSSGRTLRNCLACNKTGYIDLDELVKSSKPVLEQAINKGEKSGS